MTAAPGSRRRARASRIAGLCLVVLLFPLLLWAALYPRAARAHLIPVSDYVQVEERVYAEPALEGDAVAAVLVRMAEAEARVAGLFGSYTARPIVILSASEAAALRYSGNRYATMHPSPFGGGYVALGPEGIARVDVMAHEFAHAEHLARVGYLGWATTPAWFIEGLGMQVDDRPQYAADALAARPAEELPDADARSLGSFARFAQGDLTLHYAVSRQEVARIVEEIGPAGLDALLEGRSPWHDFDAHLEAVRSASR